MSSIEKITFPLPQHNRYSFDTALDRNTALTTQNIPGRYTSHLYTNSLNIPYNTDPLPGSDRAWNTPSIDTLPAATTTMYGNTTHPLNHNEQSFRYLVHAYSMYSLSSSAYHLDTKTRDVSKSLMSDLRSNYQYSKLKSFSDPKALSDRLTISASLIDQDNRMTYRYGGYILETTNSNIIAASNKDLMVDNWYPFSILNRTAQHERLTGSELLKRTKESERKTYNEVVIGGKSMNRGPIVITGVFYTVDKNHRPKDTLVAEHMQQVAAKYNLIAIPILET